MISSPGPLISDPVTVRMEMASWVRKRPDEEDDDTVLFSTLDEAKRFEPGMTRAHIQAVASELSYVCTMSPDRFSLKYDMRPVSGGGSRGGGTRGI